MAVFTAIATAIGIGGTFLGTLFVAGLKTLVGIGLNKLAMKLAGKKQGDGPQFSVKGQLQRGADLPQSFLIGKSATAGSLAYANTWGEAGGTPNAYLTMVISLSDIPVQSLDGIWVNGERGMIGETAHADYGFPVEEFHKDNKDHLWLKFYDGTQTVADSYLVDTASSEERPWDANSIGQGTAYAIMTARINQDLFNGFPSFLFELTGARLYDPSKDSSVGGAGSQRWSDPATWGGDGDMLPAVQLYNLFRGMRHGGEWLYGMQATTAEQMPVAHWIEQIEKCRATIAAQDGDEPKYRSGGEIAVGAPIADAMEALLDACQGRITESGGVYKLFVGQPGASVESFVDDDILSTEEQSFTPFFGLADTVNGVNAKYPDPDQGWQIETAPPLNNSDYEAEDGARRLMVDVQFDLVPYAEQVQRLMLASLNEARRARRHTFTLPPRFWALEPGDVVEWTSARNGYDAKLFRVDGVLDQPNADVVVDLTEIDPTDYDFDTNVNFTPVGGGSVTSPIYPPQPIAGWSVSASSIPDASGIGQLPAILVTWNGEIDDIAAVQVRVRVRDAGAVVVAGRFDDVEAASGLISEGILPATEYEVQGRYIPGSPRDVAWSDWLTVETLDLRLGVDDLALEVGDAIDAAQATADGAAADATQAIQDAAGVQSNLNSAVASLTVDYNATQSAAQDAQTAQTAAEAARDLAITARDAAQLAEINSETAEAGANAAQGLAQTAQVAAETAQAGAESAETSAATSATNAAGSAAGASSSATNATNSATQSGNSASAASTSASQAQTSATDAAQSASGAASSATSAATDAGSAQTYANQAASSASDAQGSENAAASSEGVATQAATDAAGHASAASTSASNAASSATQAGSSASAASNAATSAATEAGNAASYASQAATSATNADGSAQAAVAAQGVVANTALDVSDIAHGSLFRDGDFSRGDLVNWWSNSVATISRFDHSSPDPNADHSLRITSTTSYAWARSHQQILGGPKNLRGRILRFTGSINTGGRTVVVEAQRASQQGAWLGYVNSVINTPSSGWGSFSVDLQVPDTADEWIESVGFRFVPTAEQQHVYITDLDCRDVTEEVASAEHAQSAATSEANAAASDTAAGQSASAAQTARTAAETAQAGAESAETSAATSATDAAGSASSASNSASLASGSATQAGNSASAAASSANAASSSATDAGQSATSASTSANTAQTAASGAQASETSAATSATDAAGSASAAASSASVAAQAVTDMNLGQTDFQRILDGTTSIDGVGSIETVENGGAVLGQSQSLISATGAGAIETTGVTNGAYVEIPVEQALQFSGQRVRVDILARPAGTNASAGFVAAYSTSDVGNSGPQTFTLAAGWQWFNFYYDVPTASSGGADYVGLWGDATQTGGRTQFARVIVRLAPVAEDIPDIGLVQVDVSLLQAAQATTDGFAAAFAGLTATTNGGNIAGLRATSWGNPDGSGGALLELLGDVVAEGTLSTNRLVVGLGKNLLENSDFSNGLTGWTYWAASAVAPETSLLIRPAGQGWAGTLFPTLEFKQNGTSQGLADIYSPRTPITAGQWIEFSVRVSTLRCKTSCWMQFLDDAGANIGSWQGLWSDQYSSNNSQTDPEQWTQFWGKKLAPAGAAYVRVILRKNGTESSTSSFLFFHKPQLAITHDSATQPAPYSPGGTTLISGDKIMTGAITAASGIIADAAIGSAQIADLSVGTLKIADQAVTVPARSYASGIVNVTSTSLVTVASVTIDRDGYATEVSFTCAVDGNFASSGGTNVTFEVFRGTTKLGEFTDFGDLGRQYTSSFRLTDSDTGTGPTTFYVKARKVDPSVSGGYNNNIRVFRRSLSVVQFKK